jgi:hypothetical protein
VVPICIIRRGGPPKGKYGISEPAGRERGRASGSSIKSEYEIYFFFGVFPPFISHVKLVQSAENL